MKINDVGFNAYINVTSDDRWIKLYADTDNRNTYITLASDIMQCVFNENENQIADILFDKNGIAVTTNNTTYNIHEPQLSTIVNACEYSYDKDNTVHKLKMLPKVNNLDLANTPLEINFGKDGNVDLTMRFDDQGINLMGDDINGGSATLFVNDLIYISASNQYNNKLKQASITMRTDMNEPDIVIEHINDSGKPNADKILRFTDISNSLEVTFTVAELIAIKALLPTT